MVLQAVSGHRERFSSQGLKAAESSGYLASNRGLRVSSVVVSKIDAQQKRME